MNIEEQIKEILYSDSGIPEMWAGSEESIPKDKRIKKFLTLIETIKREAYNEGYNQSVNDTNQQIKTYLQSLDKGETNE